MKRFPKQAMSWLIPMAFAPNAIGNVAPLAVLAAPQIGLTCDPDATVVYRSQQLSASRRCRSRDGHRRGAPPARSCPRVRR